MILKLQRRIWENSLDFTEKSLNKMIKDEHFLHVNSFGMNSHLWWQKNAGKLGEIVLKQFNLPDKQVINRMQKNILGLERELNICKDRIEKLESEISSIIRWVEALNEVDTENVDPMSNSLTGALRMREDLVTDGNKVSDILSNSPVDDENFFVVPKVIE